jgi:aminopeptidase N
VQQTLAAVLKDSLLAVYRANIETGPYRTDQAAMGKRSLKNTCLGFLTELEDDDVRQLCLNQYRTAGNMTDALAALVDLASSEWVERDEVLASFHTKWKDDVLVMDKWLAIQATSRLPGTLDRVKELLAHPVFNIKNPNKVRALIGAFASNSIRFHDISGAGYAFIADQVLVLDPMNPQIAARLVSVFTMWKRYDEKRQALMGKELKRILGTPKLSKDVYEVVSKSLA